MPLFSTNNCFNRIIIINMNWFDYAIKFYIIYKKAMANHVYTTVNNLDV